MSIRVCWVERGLGGFAVLALVGLVGALGLAPGCGSVNADPDAAVTPPKADASTTPSIDAAAPDAATDQPDAEPTTCVPDSTTCENDTLILCDSNGDVASSTDCALGCNPLGTRCNELNPSNGLSVDLDQAATAPDLVLTDGAVIDTTAGTVTDGGGAAVAVPSRFIDDGTLPVGIFVIRAKSVVLGATEVKGTRALAIVSDGDVTLRGLLDASARKNVGGPGATAIGSSCDGGDGSGFSGQQTSPMSAFSGGGGGGFGSVGGAGGRAATVPGGRAGQVTGSPALVPLRGGCGGGGITEVANSDEFRGAGGGVVQLVSRTQIRMEASARIGVGGSAGRDYNLCTLNGQFLFCVCQVVGCPGFGAGSGGGILIEAPSVSVFNGAGLFANGGGGSWKMDGTDGQLSSMPAPGGINSIASAGRGAAGTAAATAGQSIATGDNIDTPGGGGGVGRIRINLPVGARFEPPAGFMSSPPATVGTLGVR